MERLIGTVSRGIRAPIIREGDDIVAIVTDSVIEAANSENISFSEGDVVAVTEAVVARAQGNYATIDNIATDVRNKFPGGKIGLVFPILSRNRFAVCLRGIARGADEITLMLGYPSDEVGNHLADIDVLDEYNINPWTDTLTEERYREIFGIKKHTFTGVDYIEYYKEVIENENCKATIILANDARTILSYSKDVLCCDIHTRQRSKRLLNQAGANSVFGLDDILNTSVNDSGYNDEYGLLGSNKATENKVKLFPRDCKQVVLDMQKKFKEKAGVSIEFMIYGDGAFKDPVGKIWELADPVVSPGYTSGLEGQPNEVKLKYLADNNFAELNGDELKNAIKKYISGKNDNLVGKMESQGTTPRRLTDLIGSLCDLTSGSGDKGTPIVLVQGYFDNYTK